MAGNKSCCGEIAPHLGQVFFCYPQQINTLPAGDFDRRDFIFFGDVRDGAQLRRRRDPAPDARYHRVGAVLLDIGVHAFVDEARVAIIEIVAWPCRQQIIVQSRTTLMAAIGCFPFQFLHQFRN